MAINLYILRDAQGPGASLVAGVTDAAVPRPFPALVVDDIYPVNIYLVDGVGGYDVESGGASYTIRLAVGEPGASPSSGTWPMTCGADTASGLTWDITAGALETALNALASVTAGGGVDVIGTAPFFAITWRATGAKTDFTSGANTLSPTSFVKIENKNDGSGGQLKEVFVFLAQYPLSEQTAFATNAGSNGWTGFLSLSTIQARTATDGVRSIDTMVAVSIIDSAGQPTTHVVSDVQLLRTPNMNNPISSWTPADGGFTETDPIFGASAAADITAQLIVNWNLAYSWGDHSLEGYATMTWAWYNLLSLSGGTITGQLGVGGAAPGCAQLSVTSTTKGFMPPRMTKSQRDLIPTPQAGLFIYQTDNTPGYRFYDGAAWQVMADGQPLVYCAEKDSWYRLIMKSIDPSAADSASNVTLDWQGPYSLSEL